MTNEKLNNQESLSYSQKVDLVRDLFASADTRNRYASGLAGDFDTFAESFANIPEHKAEYDRLQDIFARLRANVDQVINDKEEFVLELEGSGEAVLAEKFRSMFGLPKPRKTFSEKFKDFIGDERS